MTQDQTLIDQATRQRDELISMICRHSDELYQAAIQERDRTICELREEVASLKSTYVFGSPPTSRQH